MLKPVQKGTKECWVRILKKVCNWKQDWFYYIVRRETIEPLLDNAFCMCICDLTAWILELASNKAHDHHRRCVAPQHVERAVPNPELHLFFRDGTICLISNSGSIADAISGFQSLAGPFRASPTGKPTHSWGGPMLLPSADVIKEFGSMGVLLTPLSFCQFELEMSVGYLRGDSPWSLRI